MVIKIKIKQVFLATALLSLLHFASFSQITLSVTDVASTGDSIYLRVDTTLRGTTQTGTKGVNQTWNFTGISGILEDTVIFIPPASAPNSSSFPSVNLVSRQNAQLVYFRKDSTGLFIHGLTIDFDTLLSTDPFVVNPPLKFIGFPSTFGTNFISNGSTSTQFAVQDTLDLDSTTSFYVDSIRISITIQVIDSINGWGTLQLPNSINLPALRQQTIQNFTFGIELKIQNPLWGPNFPFNLLPRFVWIPLPAGIIPSTSFSNRSVNYYTQDRRYPVLTFTLDSAGSILTSNYQTTASIVAGLLEVHSSQKLLSIYPNPNYDGNLYLSEPTHVTIMDMQGRVVFRSTARSAQVDISLLQPGLYLLQTEKDEVFKLLKRD